jgi:predicted PurR-regulated permease PerM
MSQDRTGLPGSLPTSRRRAPSSRRPADYIVPGLALIAFFYYARPFLLPLLLACVASMALKPGMRLFARCHIPAVIGASLLMAGFLFAASCFFYYVAPPAVQWVKRAPQATVDFRQKIENIFHIHHDDTLPPAPAPSPNGTNSVAQPAASPLPLPDSQTTSTILGWTGSTLVGVGETIVLLFLILISNGWFAKKVAAGLAPRFEQGWVIETLDALQHNISHYMFSITVINIVFGTIIGAALAIIGLPNAAMWGGIAALLNFIQYFGPAAGMAMVGVAGILNFDSVPKEIFPFAFYFGLHLLEADLITPMILGHRFTIHPLAIFISLLFWTWLWGVPGAFVAVPFLVAVKVTAERHAPLATLGALLTK